MPNLSDQLRASSPLVDALRGRLDTDKYFAPLEEKQKSEPEQDPLEEEIGNLKNEGFDFGAIRKAISSPDYLGDKEKSLEIAKKIFGADVQDETVVAQSLGEQVRKTEEPATGAPVEEKPAEAVPPPEVVPPVQEPKPEEEPKKTDA